MSDQSERAYIQALSLCGVISKSVSDVQQHERASEVWKDVAFCGSDVALGCAGVLATFLRADDNVPMLVKAQLCGSVFSTPNSAYLTDLFKRYTPEKMAKRVDGYATLSKIEQARTRVQMVCEDWVVGSLPKLHQVLAGLGFDHYKRAD